MGSRLSQPKGPGGTGESSLPSKPAPPPTPAQPWGRSRRLNSRAIVAPVAAATMAMILFVYARTSIRAAKSNAQRHREADGGEGLSLINENRRRHGSGQRVEERGMFKQLADTAREDLFGQSKPVSKEVGDVKSGRSEEDQKLRSLTGKAG